MNLRFSSLLLLLVISTSALAQLSFSSGYIVRPNGDTLRGEVRQRNNQLILFQATPNTPAQPYNPAEVVSYREDGINHPVIIVTEKGKSTAYFVQEQIKGYVSLYSLFRPEGRLTHIIQLPNKTVVPLRGNLALLMLTTYLTECKSPQFTNLLRPQSFHNTGVYLERVINTYNECVKPGEPSERPKKRFLYEAGLSVMLLHNGWFYGKADKPGTPGYNPYYNPHQAFSTFNTFTVGGFITINPRKRFSMGVEFLASKYKGNLDVPLTNPLDPTATNTRYYRFEENYLALPITGRYRVFNKHLRWYLKAGIVPTLRTATTGSFTDAYSNSANLFLHESNIGIGYLAGFGVDVPLTKKRILYIEVRTMPHLVLDGVTKVATSRSSQLAVSMPLFRRD